MHTNAACRNPECSRKQYALERLRLATDRLNVAETEVEKTLATRWVNAWASAIGNRRFSEFADGRRAYRPRR